MRRLTPILFALMLVPVATFAADSKGAVTVFPFDFTESKVDKGSRIVLEEEVRSVTTEMLANFGYNVMTGETQLQLLEDKGIDPGKVGDASSWLGTARQIRAAYFITGTVTASEGTNVAFVRLFRVRDGVQLKSMQLEGKEIREMRESFRKQSATFFSTVPGVAPPAPAGGSTSTASTPKVAKVAPAPAIAADMVAAGQFKVNETAAYDTTTNLTWQRRVGKKPFSEPPDEYCAHLNLGGTTGWRLPTKDELLGLVTTSDDGSGPTIDRAAFPETPSSWYWTTTREGEGDFLQAWKVNFEDGRSEQSFVKSRRSKPALVRCVR